MTSIMTNTAAMTALSTLQMTNKSLDETQSRISTGYRVAEASDNAAYWSIASTMRSDNQSMSAVKDSLGIGAATVDTAYTGMTAVKDVLDEIKAKLTTATGENVDKTKVQGEISQLQKQLTSISDSASFSGQNFLNVGEKGVGTSSIISSFSRDSNGSLSLGSIAIDTSKTALFSGKVGEAGLLQKSVGNTDTGGLKVVSNTTADAGTTKGKVALDAFGGSAITLDGDDTISFDLAIDGAASKTYTISKATVDAALSSTDGKIADAAAFQTVLGTALGTADAAKVTITNTAGVVSIESKDATAASAIAISNVAASNGGVNFNATDFSIDNTTTATQVQDYIKGIDSMLSKVTSAAADLGSVKTRIDMQTTFTGNLMDAIDRGVGTLVDADMTEESTRLKALQTQQQLGVQALSIANSSSQSLLSLFR